VTGGKQTLLRPNNSKNNGIPDASGRIVGIVTVGQVGIVALESLVPGVVGLVALEGLPRKGDKEDIWRHHPPWGRMNGSLLVVFCTKRETYFLGLGDSAPW